MKYLVQFSDNLSEAYDLPSDEAFLVVYNIVLESSSEEEAMNVAFGFFSAETELSAEHINRFTCSQVY